MHMDTNGILLGAIAGDVIGSYYEHFRTKNYNFELFRNRSKCTDDTKMTVAVAHWLLEEDRSPETIKRVQESSQLIMDTIHMNETAVAAQIEKVHIEATNPLNANNENSLRAVIQLAYFSYKDYYLKMEELPAGHGYADIVYLPRQGETVPALVIELKWNKTADTAVEQIKRNRYPEALRGLGSDILLVGINYDKDMPAGQRRYTCKIEKVNRG